LRITGIDIDRDFFALLSENNPAVREDRLVGSEPFHGRCRIIVASVPHERDDCTRADLSYCSCGVPVT
jgi:hypothetical protein